MSGSRQPTAVLIAKGKKHLTRAEIEERKAKEVHNCEPVKQLRSPAYLPEQLRERFGKLAKQLIALMPTMVARPDADTLARYVMAEDAFCAAYDNETQAIARGMTDMAGKWAAIADKHFKQCRNCATDLGLTLSARCNLVIPQGAEKEPENPFLTLLERKDA